MRIAEIFNSVQGEGFLTGTGSVFVRASGCNLRCRFCDTPYASWTPVGEDMAVHDIARHVSAYDLEHVVLTGGEPMLFAELVPLCEQLRDRGHHITVETAGTLYLPLQCDLMSISPKLSNSTPPEDGNPRWRQRHEKTRHDPEVIRKLTRDHAYQIKFVVDDPRDCDEIERYLDAAPEIDIDAVMLMPQGTDPDALARTRTWLEPYCEQRGMRFCPRKQVEWFGLVRGT